MSFTQSFPALRKAAADNPHIKAIQLRTKKLLSFCAIAATQLHAPASLPGSLRSFEIRNMFWCGAALIALAKLCRP
jgi:hypothetical protein